MAVVSDSCNRDAKYCATMVVVSVIIMMQISVLCNTFDTSDSCDR